MPLTLEKANTIISAALEHARQENLKPLSVIILDDRAALVAAQSEDGVSIMRSKIAFGKANGAIQLGMGSRALMARAEQQAYFVSAINGTAGGDLVPVPGGVLIEDNCKVVGVIGISGDVSDNDEAAAIAGITAAGFSAITG